MSNAHENLKGKASDELKWLDLVVQQVGSLRYGTVEIIVHDSQVTQIEKTERLRLGKPAESRI